MFKKADDYYFNNFVESAKISCEAAEMLKDVLVNFNVNSLPKKMNLIHEIERRGDERKHEMTAELVRAFITPIERDDILKLSQNIDDVTDAVEDIIIQVYINNVTKIRPDSLDFADIIIKCCNATKEMLEEFKNFKKSKKLNELLIEINRLEEVGDEMYINTMKKLHTEGNDALTVIAWREIYGFFERCCDACENVAIVVEGITIGNT